MRQITRLVHETTNTAQRVLDTYTDLSEASKYTGRSAQEIAATTEEIAKGSSQLALESEGGAILTEEMGHRLHKVVESTLRMDEAARSIDTASEQGSGYMAFLMDRTGTAEEMTRDIVQKVNKLNESTLSIREIFDLLNNINKKTNVLSINAMIEASRAGDAGQGFRVCRRNKKKTSLSVPSVDRCGSPDYGVHPA